MLAMFYQLHDLGKVIILDAPCGLMAGSAALAEAELIVVDTDTSRPVFSGKPLLSQTNDLCSCAVPHGAAIDDKHIHR